MALVGHHHQQLIFGILQNALLPRLEILALGEEGQGLFSPDAAQRHDEGDARAGHVDVQLPLHGALHRAPDRPGDQRKDDHLFRLFQAEVVQQLAARRALPQGAQGDGDTVLGEQVHVLLGGAPGGDGDHEI